MFQAIFTATSIFAGDYDLPFPPHSELHQVPPGVNSRTFVFFRHEGRFKVFVPQWTLGGNTIKVSRPCYVYVRHSAMALLRFAIESAIGL